MKVKAFFLVALFVAASVVASASSLSSLVPANAYFVLNCDFAAVMAQPEVKAVLEHYFETSGQNFTDFYERAGMNPTKAFKTVMLFLDENNQPGIVIQGTFDSADISKLIQIDEGLSASFSIGKIGGFQAVKNGLNENANMIFLDKNTMAFGSDKMLNTIATLARGKAKNIISNPHYSGLIEKVDSDSQLWGVIIPSPNWQKRANMPVSGVEDMTSAFFSIDYGKDFIFIFTGMVEKKEQLPAFAEGMENILDAFKGWVASVPEVHELLRHAQVMNNQEKLARIVLNVPAEQFKAMMTKTAERSKQN